MEEETAVKNRYYPAEFKWEVLAMLAESEYKMATLRRELGSTPGLLGQWKRRAKRNGEYASANSEPAVEGLMAVGAGIGERLGRSLQP